MVRFTETFVAALLAFQGASAVPAAAPQAPRGEPVMLNAREPQVTVTVVPGEINARQTRTVTIAPSQINAREPQITSTTIPAQNQAREPQTITIVPGQIDARQTRTVTVFPNQIDARQTRTVTIFPNQIKAREPQTTFITITAQNQAREPQTAPPIPSPPPPRASFTPQASAAQQLGINSTK
ncbi:hypothetical protein MN608_06410 [Microdochium nivale]|nr:hypothetical protein MN608_06410 [Microdochium nivale]